MEQKRRAGRRAGTQTSQGEERVRGRENEGGREREREKERVEEGESLYLYHRLSPLGPQCTVSPLL